MQRLVACERSATAALLRCLMEIDARRLYLREGCSSLFTYCTQVLHLAEGAAYSRTETARAARRFPAVLDAIADGSITLTSARLLAPHLTAENHQDLLAGARYKSKREVEVLVAMIHPQPEAPTMLRRLPPDRETGAGVVVQGAGVGEESTLTGQSKDNRRKHQVSISSRLHSPHRRASWLRGLLVRPTSLVPARRRSRGAPTNSRSRSLARRTTSCVVPRICCGMRCRTETLLPSSTGP